MAIQHLEDAATQPLHAAAKLVLMAIADDANRETRVAFPGAAKLATWADITEARVPGVLQELIARQLIARRSKGRRGKRTEYIVFPTIDEIEQLDDVDPTLNQVSPSTLERVKKQDAKRAQRLQPPVETFVHADEIAADQAVDNFQEWVAPVRPFSGVRVAHDPAKGRPGATPPVSTPGTTPESSTERHQSAAVDNPTDSTQHPHPQPRHGRPLDLIAVTTSAAALLAPTGITEPGIAQLATEILDRCPAPVLDPTAYVVQTLRQSGLEWQRRAFDIALGVDAATPTLDFGAEF